MGILWHPVVGQLLGELPLQEAVREKTLSLCLMGLFGENVWGMYGRNVWEFSMGDLWAKGLKIFQTRIYGNFQGNVRECLGIVGDFLGKIDQKEMSRRVRGELSGRLCGGCSRGNVRRWIFFWGGGFVYWKYLKECGGIFLGNVWGLSRKALSGRNVA